MGQAMRIELTACAVAAAMLATSVAAFAQQTSATGIRLSGDGPIQIESDRLEVRENDGIAIFTGNVAVVQGPTLLRAGRMVVHYAQGAGSAATGSAQIERLEVEDKVYVRSENQVATGDTGSFDMRTDVLVLAGKEVVLTEGDNVVVGCRLTVQMATGLSELEGCAPGTGGGRVKMLLRPASQDR